jgi:hypothetical protein
MEREGIEVEADEHSSGRAVMKRKPAELYRSSASQCPFYIVAHGHRRDVRRAALRSQSRMGIAWWEKRVKRRLQLSHEDHDRNPTGPHHFERLILTLFAGPSPVVNAGAPWLLPGLMPT